MRLPVPVNIITGTLGVGKTTAISNLVRSKPPTEKWALLVNEFGALGIDAALLTASAGSSSAGPPVSGTGAGLPTSQPGSAPGGVVVRELAGGCLCCTLSGPLGVAIAQLVRQTRPDRLIIEPSGLGHPAGLLDVLYSEHLRSALDLKAVICLVDVRVAAALAAEEEVGSAGGGASGVEGAAAGGAAAAEGRRAAAGGGEPLAAARSETFQDQVNVADVLVGHKADLADGDQRRAFERWAEQLYPPKVQVSLASHGHIDPALLDLPRMAVYRPLFSPQSHVSRRRAAQKAARASAVLGRAADEAAAGASHGAAQNGSADTQVTSAVELLGIDSTDSEPSGSEATLPPPVSLLPGKPARFPSAPLHTDPPGRPHEAASQPGQQEAFDEVSCGWLFSAEDVFDRTRLAEVLAAVWPRAARLKGVFRLGKSSYGVPYLRSDGTVELKPMSYRRESRLEIIVRVQLPAPGTAAGRVQAPGWDQGPGAAGAHAGTVPVAAAAHCGGAEPVAADGQGAASGNPGAAERLAAAVASADWDAVERALLGALRS